MSEAELLSLDNVNRAYGAIAAVADVSLSIGRGSRLGVIGPNGAGKSTLFGLISGRIPPSSGTIRFEGRDITRMSEAGRACRGIAQSFQQSSLFPSMTCRETIVLARQRAQRGRSSIVPRPGLTRRLAKDADEALDAVDLGDRGGVVVGGLSHGEKRQLDVAVALASGPSLLLLDEPTAGMSGEETRRFVEFVGNLPRELTIVIVEHDMDVVFGIADEVAVLNLGRLLAHGTPEEIRASSEVEEAYLGAVTRRSRDVTRA